MYIEEMLEKLGLDARVFDARKGVTEKKAGDVKAGDAIGNYDSLWAPFDDEEDVVDGVRENDLADDSIF